MTFIGQKQKIPKPSLEAISRAFQGKTVELVPSPGKGHAILLLSDLPEILTGNGYYEIVFVYKFSVN